MGRKKKTKDPEYWFEVSLHSQKRTYDRWQWMWRVCTDPNDPEYRNFGRKGVKVDPRWEDFNVFVSDAGYASTGDELEMKYPNGNFEPGNVRYFYCDKQGKKCISLRDVTPDDHIPGLWAVVEIVLKWMEEEGIE